MTPGQTGWFVVTLTYQREDDSLHQFVFSARGNPMEVQREAIIRFAEYMQGTLHRWVDSHGVPTTQEGARAIMRLTNPGKYGPGLTQ